MESVDWKSVPHKVPARPEERVLLRVEMAGRGGLVAQQRVPAGTHHVICYRSELAEVQRQCATEEQLRLYAVAREAHERKLEQHLAGLRKKGADAEAIKRATREYPGSPESEYHFLRGEASGDRGVPTLRKVTVVCDVPPPDMPVTRAMAAQDQIAQVVQALGSMPETLATALGQALANVLSQPAAQPPQQKAR